MSEIRKTIANKEVQVTVRMPNPYEEFFPKINLKHNEFLKGIGPLLLTCGVICTILLFVFVPNIATFLAAGWGILSWLTWYKWRKHVEDMRNLILQTQNTKEKYEILSDIMGRIDKNVLARHGISLDILNQKPEENPN